MPTEPEPAPATRSDHRVVFGVNHLHGLYTFVRTLARGAPHAAPFAASRHDTPALRASLAEFSALVPFGGDATGPGNRDRLCAAAAGQARGLDDFRERLAAAMPHHDLSRLVTALGRFREAYDDLVRAPTEPVLVRWRRLLRRVARSRGLDAVIGRVARFYRTTWDPAVPFRVLLRPVPLGTEVVSCTLDANVVTLAVPAVPRDPANWLGIVVHEVCHGFHENRPPALLASEGADLPADAPGVYARRALEEALATAIGNGWAVRRLGGSLPEDRWYDDWHVRTFAVALTPAVGAALDGTGALDGPFLRRAIDLYRAAIGERMWDLANLLKHVAVLTDEGFRGESPGLAERLAARVDGLASVEELDGRGDLERLLGCDATRLVILRADDDAAVAAIAARVGWLRVARPKPPHPFVAGRVRGPDPALFVLALERLDDLERALAALDTPPDGEGLIVRPL